VPEPALAQVSRALVIGLGRAGVAAAEALLDAGVEVIAADAANVHVPEGLRDRADVRTGADHADVAGVVDKVDLVVPSPGVPEGSPVVRAAVEAGRLVWSEPELGWQLQIEAEGKGYAFEAAIAMRDWAFQVRKLKTLVSYIGPDNARSIRLADRLGATLDGEPVEFTITGRTDFYLAFCGGLVYVLERLEGARKEAGGHFGPCTLHTLPEVLITDGAIWGSLTVDEPGEYRACFRYRISGRLDWHDVYTNSFVILP
jgi:hypothetical protein